MSAPEELTKYDEVLLTVAGQCGGIEPLLDVFFSALSADLYLLLPAMAIDLHDAIRLNRLTAAVHKQSIAFQLTCALGHMHAFGVLHRDLKPQNVLLDAECTVRLCDFGLSLIHI